MRSKLTDRLFRRELGYHHRDHSIKGIYGDKAWIDNLDIVNELGGHSGCVNALSWSKSGRLLASGSDDTNVVIHTYQPESGSSPFSMTTSISTGHVANIFSVKFMPHSNDNTIITAAGDAECRVFDLEYSGTAVGTGAPDDESRRMRARKAFRMDTTYQGVRYLSDRNTNARVYRSHADRVKRIVTESSPHLFLTCSEDGTVRQWDLRLPSSAYPAPQGGRGFMAHRDNHDDSNVPPPLISYKRYRLDLNTISCSPSQPHYIVLGGAHLHCFLHDRRMLGRDRLVERGSPGSGASSLSNGEDDLMGEATRCVRRFAPNGRKTMRRTENGHVTACKISDANPNEMIGSWSGDYIYSFDLVRSPDARSERNSSAQTPVSRAKSKAKESKERKRKWKHEIPSTSIEGADRDTTRPRHTDDDGSLILRVRYENGQSEDIEFEQDTPETLLEQARDSVLTPSQHRSMKIARSIVKIRKLLFSLEPASATGQISRLPSDHATAFTSVLQTATQTLCEMDEIIRTWKYPVNPRREEVIVHTALRRNRDRCRRFVQAAGTVAKALGGELPLTDPDESPNRPFFDRIGPAATQGPLKDKESLFGYTLLKAILLWLRGGREALLGQFVGSVREDQRHGGLPIPEGSDISGIEDHLIPYLLQLASAKPIPNVDVSRFEVDANRHLFNNGNAVVTLFARAIEIPFQDEVEEASSSSTGSYERADRASSTASQGRNDALRFWGFRVSRGLLLNAGEGVTFELADRAFGGLGKAQNVDGGRAQDEIDPEAKEDVIISAGLRKKSVEAGPDESSSTLEGKEASSAEQNHKSGEAEVSCSGAPTRRSSTEEAVGLEDLLSQIEYNESDIDEGRTPIATDDDDNDGVENENSDDRSDEYDSEDDEDEEDALEGPQFIFQSAAARARNREQVQKDTPVNPHTRQYRGHCNVKTVKDVNFFGLQDEYVVSGSDSGHLFIWDRKTSQLLNILEGDGEVVNVVQGHPYEPMLAVSGIDHTIKIFSPDNRAQKDARRGVNLNVAPGQSDNRSSLNWFGVRPRRTETALADSDAHGSKVDAESDEENEMSLSTPIKGGLSSRKRMHDSYQITSQNDTDRIGGNRDAFLTRDMLARLAEHMHERRVLGIGNLADGDNEAGNTQLILDDRSCTIM